MTELNINSAVTIGTTALEISQERMNKNAERKSVSITNTSPAGQKISLAIDNMAVSGAGIVLSVGGFWSDSADGQYKPTQEQITAVSDAAGGTIALQERVETAYFVGGRQ